MPQMAVAAHNSHTIAVKNGDYKRWDITRNF